MSKEKNKKSLGLAAVLALTLGLAPFAPEPHIIGKIKWIMGGANGMELMDYFDTLLHGAPWVYLIYLLYKYFTKAEEIPDK